MQQQLVEKVYESFKDSKWSLGFAESCTGGLISSWLARRAGVSSFFKGSVVSYAAEVKQNLLHVRASDIEAHGEVSESVALQMAQGACQALAVDWAVSVTGIAGPSGGSDEKPVGTVCFAIVGPNFEKAITHHFDRNLSRGDIQTKTAEKAFELLLDGIKS